MKWPIRSPRPLWSRRSRKHFRCSPLALEVESLEVRLVLSAAFDVTDLTALRNDPQFAGIDGALPDGTKIGIAIIDSGVLASHADLQSNFLAFFDAVATDANADGIITPADTESAAGAFDPDGHGTHVSGTAASSNPDVGVATRAGLIGIRGLPGPGETFPQHDTLLSALQWVEENHQRYNIKVVNMSIQNGTNLNGMPNANDFARQIEVLESLGITVVAASGNSYADFAALGASFPAVFSSLSVANTWEDAGVGDRLPALGAGPRPQFVAIDFAPEADDLAGSSQRSTLPNQVAAPGSTIFSTWNDGGYNTISGTSMSSPFVAGLVALVQDAAFTFGGRYLSVNEVVDVVRNSADVIFDAQNPDTQRARILRNPDGTLSLGTLEDLLETEETFLRVNAYNAVQTTVLLVSENEESENGDVNNTLTSGIAFPPLNGTQEFSISGNIGTDGAIEIGPDDVDLFEITVQSPGQLRVETGPISEDLVDLYLRIFDASGTEIAAQNDAAGGNLYPDLTTNVLSPGVYYIGLSSFANTDYDPNDPNSASGGGDTGDYQFTASLINPDPNGVIQGALEVDLTSPNAINSNPFLVNQGVYVTNQFLDQEAGLDGEPTAVAAPLIPEGQTNAVAVGPTDVDFFRVVAPDSGLLFVEVDTSFHGANGIDSYIEVFTFINGTLTSIGSNDDASASTTDSVLAVEIEIGQTYYIAVTTSGNQNFDPEDPFGRSSTTSDTGLYDLYLSYSNGDVNGTAFGAVEFTDFDEPSDGVADNILNGDIGSDFGQPLLGASGGFKDVDFFIYTATEDGLLDIQVLPQPGSLNPLNGVIGVWELAPSQTDIIQIVDTSSLSPQAILEVSAGQTMWISVTGLGNHGFNWAAPGSGTGGDTGQYRLSIQERPASDLAALTNNSIQSTPTLISLDQLITENIGTDNQTFLGPDDVDIFAYAPQVNQAVVIRTFSDQEGSADTFLRIFDAQGQELAANNDAGPGTKGSEITILLTAGQMYFIGVSGNGANADAYDPLTGGNAADGSMGNYSILITELPPPIYAAAADAGGGPHVRVFDARTNEELASFFAYDPGFFGGVRVAVGDVTGDGIDDVVTVPGPGGGPHVRVLDGATLQFRTEPQYNFMALQPGMTMGLYVAVGDLDNDGFGDIIITPDAGSSPIVMAFSGRDGSLLKSFFAYNLNVSGGVRVAAGDVNGDGFADIITVPGPGFPAHVRVFDAQIPQSGLGRDLAQSESLRIGSFIAFPGFTGGAYVAAGDVTGDGKADVILGAGPGGGPHVQVFDADNAEPFIVQSFFAYAAGFTGGVRVGASEFGLDGRAEVVTSPGPGGGPHVRLFDGQQTPANVSNLFAFGAFTGGVFVAGGGDYDVLDQSQTLAAGFSFLEALAASLTRSDVAALQTGGIARFEEVGAGNGQMDQVETVLFSLSDLSGDLLSAPVDGTSLFDLSAAGLGWSIDPTRFADEVFTPKAEGNLTAITSPADTGVDLLSVIVHDDDQDADLFPDQLLADTVAPGERRLPDFGSLDALFAEDDLFANLLESTSE